MAIAGQASDPVQRLELEYDSYSASALGSVRSFSGKAIALPMSVTWAREVKALEVAWVSVDSGLPGA